MVLDMMRLEQLVWLLKLKPSYMSDYICLIKDLMFFILFGNINVLYFRGEVSML